MFDLVEEANLRDPVVGWVDKRVVVAAIDRGQERLVLTCPGQLEASATGCAATSHHCVPALSIDPRRPDVATSPLLLATVHILPDRSSRAEGSRGDGRPTVTNRSSLNSKRCRPYIAYLA